ncbi:MAG TPA: sigma-54 dependent transcriptional regulator [Longimicrobiales bacterium]
MTRILIVDDVLALAEQYAYDLQRLGGWRVRIATSGPDALEALADEALDCVILDLEMPGMDGFEVLRRMNELGVDVPVIVYTGTGDYDRCVRAVRLGAFGFIDKAEPMQRVVQEVRQALDRGRLASEVKTLRARLDVETSLIGSSPVMQRLREEIRKLAPIPSPVLVLGESGTGKELVARDLHALGPGEKQPFVALNSAALPENLVESELFGHERGAFTGADRQRKGAFERAGRGTLFLDEIGDLPLPAQAKLLRALENREVTRLGGDRPVAVEARVVAATHRDLERAVEEKAFRQDLFYRLNVHVLRVPPLRDRLSDIPELVDHFLVRLCQRFGMRRKRIAPDALAPLMRYDWRRNNVRELRNAVERMLIASDGATIEGDDVPAEIVEGGAARAGAAGSGRAGPPGADGSHPGEAGRPRTFQERKAEAERAIVLEALHAHDWHITQTAEALGLADHASLLKIMRRLGVRREGEGA